MRLLRAAVVSLIFLTTATAAAFEPIEGTEVMLFDRSGQTLLGYGRILGGMLRLELTGLDDPEAAWQFLMVVASPEGEVLTLPASLDENGQLLVESGEADPEPLTALLAEGSVGLVIFRVPRPEFATGDPGESTAGDAATDVAETPGATSSDEEAEVAAEPPEEGSGVAGGGSASRSERGRSESPPGQEEGDERGPPDDGGGPASGERGKAPPNARESRSPSDRESGRPDGREPGPPGDREPGPPGDDRGGGPPDEPAGADEAEEPGKGKGRGRDR